jgi:predicted nucleotidyltransferase
MEKTRKQFDQILKNLKKDPNVIGAFLSGSRGKGFEHEYSDYDLYVIVKDDNSLISKKKYPRNAYRNIDLITKTIFEFKNYARFGGPEDWDRYSFAHVKPLFDKSGTLQEILKQKGCIPLKYQKKQVSDFLDMYLNALYRSIKYFKTNLTVSRFEAAKSLEYLVGALFALEGRTQPYHGYLEKELIKFPLKKFPWKPQEFVKIMLKILNSADLKVQREVLEKVEKLFRKYGFEKNFNAWSKIDLWKLVKKA